MTCSWARYLLIAGFVGVAASSISGSDLVGLLTAALAVMVTVALERLGPLRTSRGSCALPDDVDRTDREPTPR